jgi:hypothetical protein
MQVWKVQVVDIFLSWSPLSWRAVVSIVVRFRRWTFPYHHFNVDLMPSSMWWRNFYSICTLTRATRWAPFNAKTEIFVYLSQWLRPSQDDTELCSSSHIGNLNCTLFFILEIAGRTYNDTYGCHASFLTYTQQRFTAN